MSQRRLLPLAQLPPAQPQPRGGARPYARGSRAERELLGELRHAGRVAFRSAGSAGPFDVYALGPGGGSAYQVKLVTARPTDGQIARWLAALPALPDGWQGAVAVKVAGGAWTFYRPDGEEQSA